MVRGKIPFFPIESRQFFRKGLNDDLGFGLKASTEADLMIFFYINKFQLLPHD